MCSGLWRGVKGERNTEEVTRVSYFSYIDYDSFLAIWVDSDNASYAFFTKKKIVAQTWMLKDLFLSQRFTLFCKVRKKNLEKLFNDHKLRFRVEPFGTISFVSWTRSLFQNRIVFQSIPNIKHVLSLSYKIKIEAKVIEIKTRRRKKYKTLVPSFKETGARRLMCAPSNTWIKVTALIKYWKERRKLDKKHG